MECNCIGQMVNGIIYGMGLSVAVWAIMYLGIDFARERRDRA